MSRPGAHDTDVLERYLLGFGEAPPELLEAVGLAAYAYARQPQQARLKQVFLSATARHATLRREVQQLVAAWHDVGIPCLVFKGFYVAEFVYPVPGARRYSDVDLLMRAEDTVAASTIAQQLGWQQLWHANEDDTLHRQRDTRYQGHEVLELWHDKLGVQLDVHRRIVHNNHNLVRATHRHESITQAAWQEAQTVTWGETEIRTLQPVDSILIGLVLNRSWSSDAWQLRPHDYPDFAALVTHFGVTREELAARAHELGCTRTLELFLARCDPYRNKLDLRPPSAAQLRLWNLRVAPERGQRDLERFAREALELPRQVTAVARALPLAHRTLKLLELYAPEEALKRLQVSIDPEPAALRYAEWRDLRQGVHRSLRLLGADPNIMPAATAVALCAALRRLGLRAELRTLAEAPNYQLAVDGRTLNLNGTVLERKEG